MLSLRVALLRYSYPFYLRERSDSSLCSILPGRQNTGLQCQSGSLGSKVYYEYEDIHSLKHKHIRRHSLAYLVILLLIFPTNQESTRVLSNSPHTHLLANKSQ